VVFGFLFFFVGPIVLVDGCGVGSVFSSLEIWRCCSLRRGVVAVVVVVVVYTQCLVQDTHNGSTTTEQHDAGHTRNRKKQGKWFAFNPQYIK